MFVDISIKETAYNLPIKIGVLVITLLLMVMMDVLWWQYVVVTLVWTLCLWMDKVRAIAIHELSTHDPDDVWYLGVYDKANRQIWQAYLSDVTLMGQSVVMTFGVIVPYEMTHQITIHHSMVSEQDFRQLASLQM